LHNEDAHIGGYNTVYELRLYEFVFAKWKGDKKMNEKMKKRMERTAVNTARRKGFYGVYHEDAQKRRVAYAEVQK